MELDHIQIPFNPLWILILIMMIVFHLTDKKNRTEMQEVSFFIALIIMEFFENFVAQISFFVKHSRYAICVFVWLLFCLLFYIRKFLLWTKKKIWNKRKEKERKQYNIEEKDTKRCRFLIKECRICLKIVGILWMIRLVVILIRNPILTVYWQQLINLDMLLPEKLRWIW